MKVPQVFGLVVAVLVSAWASISFFRGSIIGAPPLYSRGWWRRSLHFAAGILFGALTLAACLKLFSAAVGSQGSASEGRLVEQYRAATCIPFSAKPTVFPHTREWNTQLTLKDHSTVTVRGAQSPGGRIEVEYQSSGQRKVAADAGDYVYPSDVRLNDQNNVLYVKASGLAGGISHETWLFAYDLSGQQLITRKRVADNALPAECQETVKK
jgi:hypothetical protein